MENGRGSEPAPMYPVPTHWPNTLWSIGAVVLGVALVANLVLFGFGVRDQLGRGLLSLVGAIFANLVLFVWCVDRTSWAPSWLTTFLDRRLRRRSDSQH